MLYVCGRKSASLLHNHGVPGSPPTQEDLNAVANRTDGQAALLANLRVTLAELKDCPWPDWP